jgi:hypothetical protein
MQKGIKIKIHPTLRCCPTGVKELSGCSSMTLTVVKQSNKRPFCTNANSEINGLGQPVTDLVLKYHYLTTKNA